MDGGVESGFIGESQVGEMMRFEVAPDTFDVVEFRRIFREALDAEPMSAGSKCRQRSLADVDRAVVEDDDDGLGFKARPWTVEPVEGFQKGNEIGATLGAGSGDGQLAAAANTPTPISTG